HNTIATTVTRADKLARARRLIAATGQVAPARKPPEDGTGEETTRPEGVDHPCPHCGGRMLIIERFEAPRSPSHPPSAPFSLLTPIPSSPSPHAPHSFPPLFRCPSPAWLPPLPFPRSPPRPAPDPLTSPTKPALMPKLPCSFT